MSAQDIGYRSTVDWFNGTYDDSPTDELEKWFGNINPGQTERNRRKVGNADLSKHLLEYARLSAIQGETSDFGFQQGVNAYPDKLNNMRTELLRSSERNKIEGGNDPLDQFTDMYVDSVSAWSKNFKVTKRHRKEFNAEFEKYKKLKPVNYLAKIFAQTSEDGTQPFHDSIKALNPEQGAYFMSVLRETQSNQERSQPEKFKEAFRRGTVRMVNNLQSIATKLLGLGDIPPEELDRWIKANELRRANDPLPEDPLSIEAGALGAAEMVPSLAANTALSMATGGLGIAGKIGGVSARLGLKQAAAQSLTEAVGSGFWFTQIQPGRQRELEANGVDPSLARNISVITSIPEAILERLQLNNLKPNIKKGLHKEINKSYRKYFSSSLKANGIIFGENLTQEGLQELVGLAGRTTGAYLGKNAPGLVAADEIQSFINDMQQAAISLPFLLGAGKLPELAVGTKTVYDTKIRARLREKAFETADQMAWLQGRMREQKAGQVAHVEDRPTQYRKGEVSEVTEENKKDKANHIGNIMMITNPESLSGIINNPSRKNFKELGFPVGDKETRVRVQAYLKGVRAKNKSQAETPSAPPFNLSPERLQAFDRLADSENTVPAELPRGPMSDIQDMDTAALEEFEGKLGLPGPTALGGVILNRQDRVDFANAALEDLKETATEALDDQGSMTSEDLAKEMGIEPDAVGEVVGRLLESGKILDKALPGEPSKFVNFKSVENLETPVVERPDTKEFESAVTGIPEVQGTDLNVMNRPDLKAEAARNGLNTRGSKRQLIKLLKGLASKKTPQGLMTPPSAEIAESAQVGEQVPPEVAEKASNVPQKAVTLVSSEGELYKNVFLVPTERILTDAEVMQFKLDVDKDGIQKGQRLEGEWDVGAAGILLVWQSKDGKLFVVNGHHRLEFAKRKGVKALQVEIVREVDGVSVKNARALGAESNIISGGGNIYDHAEYFRQSEYTEEIARTRNVVDRGFWVGKHASDNTYALFRAGKITPEQAAAISKAGRGDDGKQLAGVTAALEDKSQSPLQLEHFMNALGLHRKAVGGQGSMFYDDTAIKEGNLLSEEVAKRISEANKTIAILSAPANKPEVLEKFGFPVDDPKALKKKRKALRVERDDLSMWMTNSDLVKELREAVGLDPLPEKPPLMQRPNNEKQPLGGQGAFAYRYEGETPGPGKKGVPISGDATAVLQLPDLVDLEKSLLGGKLPKIVKNLPARMGQASGAFTVSRSEGKIQLKSDIFIGPEIETVYVKKIDVEDAKDSLRSEFMDKYGLSEDDIIFRHSVAPKTGKTALTAYRRNPNFASKVLAHEIGHVVSWLPDKEMKRGNILGQIASLKNSILSSIGDIPENVSDHLTKTERTALSLEAGKQARRRVAGSQKFPPIAKEPFETAAKKKAVADETAKIYRRMVEKSVANRNLFDKTEITNELKKLTEWWKPFDPAADEDYTKYRHRTDELYADALSVLLNNPAALSAKAPKFRQAFFSYLDNKPEVKVNYESIVDKIRQGPDPEKRVSRLQNMLRENTTRMISKLEPKNPNLREAFNWFKYGLLDPFFATKEMAAKLRHAGVLSPDVDPEFSIEHATYVGARKELYYQSMSVGVRVKLEKSNMDWALFDEYMFHLRVSEEREMLANPDAWTKPESQKRIQEIRDNLGEDRFSVLEDSRKKFWDIRKELVISKLKDLKLFSSALESKLRDNENYVTFNVVKDIDEEHGGNVGAKIWKQEGTFEDIAGPATATLLKDASLMASLDWMAAKRTTVDMLLNHADDGVITPADMKYDGKNWVAKEPKDKESALFQIMHEGNLESYYVPKDIAKGFDREPGPAFKLAAKTLGLAMMAPRLVQVAWNPGYWASNIARDAERALMNIPGANAWKLGKYYMKALKPEFRDYLGVPDDVMAEMKKGQMLISVANFRGFTDKDVESERLLVDYVGKPYNHPKGWKQQVAAPVQKFFRKFLKAGQFIERLPKVAGYMMLKESRPDLSPEEIAHMVRTQIGSPAFLIGGAASPITNNLWLYSNPMIQAVRSDAEVIKARPGEQALKFAKYYLLPKMMQFAFSSGIMNNLYSAMGGDDDDDTAKYFRGIKSIFDGVSEYDMTNYYVVPIALDANNKSVVLRIPQDQTARLGAGVFWKMLNKFDDPINGLQGALKYGGEQGLNANPLLTIGAQILDYMGGGNPYDSFRGRPLLTRQEQSARGSSDTLARWEVHKKFMKTIANSAGVGIIYKFKTYDTYGVQSELEKILNWPGVSNTLGRFLKVTDYGKTEKLNAVKIKKRGERAGVSLRLKAIAKKLRDDIDLTSEERGILTDPANKRILNNIAKRGELARTVSQRFEEAQ